MRRATALAALLPLVLLTGCGGSSSAPASPPAGRSSAPSASSSSAQVPPTKAAAAAAAAAINLTAAEVGAGYTSAPSKKNPADDKDNAALAACIGSTPPSSAVVDVPSPDFTIGSGLQMRQVSSDVTVVPTNAQARSDLAAYHAAKATACLKTFIAKLLAGAAGPSVTFGPPLVTTVETPAPGADGSFGYDVKLTAKATGITLSFDVLLQAVLVKRSEVALTLLSIGQPFPVPERTRLLQALAAKASTHAV